MAYQPVDAPTVTLPFEEYTRVQFAVLGNDSLFEKVLLDLVSIYTFKSEQVIDPAVEQ